MCLGWDGIVNTVVVKERVLYINLACLMNDKREERFAFSNTSALYLHYYPIEVLKWHSVGVITKDRRGTVEPLVLWGSWDPRAHGFESLPRSEWRLGIHSG